MRKTFSGVSLIWIVVLAVVVPIIFLSACGDPDSINRKSLDNITLYDKNTGEKLASSFYAGEEIYIDIEQVTSYEYAELWGKDQGAWESLQTLEKTDKVYFTFPDVAMQTLQINFLDKNKEVLNMVWLGDFNKSNPPLYSNEIVQMNSRYTPEQNKLHQFLALNYLLLLGLLFLFIWNKRNSDFLAAVISFVFGAGIYSLATILLLFLRIPTSFFTVNIGLLIFMLIVLFIKRKDIIVNKKKISVYLTVYVLFTLLSIVLVNGNAAILGYDSYQYVLGGYGYGVTGEITESFAKVMSRFGLFPMIAHTLSYFLTFDFMYAYQPMFVLTGCVSFAAILYENCRERKLNWKKSAALSLLGVLFLMSCYFWLFQTFWIMGNIQVAIFLILAVYFGLQGEKDGGNLVLSFLMLFCMAACRLETPLQGLILAVFIAGNISVTNRLKKIYLISYSSSIILWYLAHFSFSGLSANEDEISWGTIGPVIICCVLVILYAALLNKKWAAWLQKNINKIAFIGANVLLVLLFAVKPVRSLETVEVILQNLLAHGFWGMMWLMLFLLAAGNLLYYKKLQLTDLMVYVLIFTVIALGIIRNTPLRLGFGDSVNRMMVHVYPLLIYGIMQSVLPEKQPAGEKGRN